jgi:dGTPase
MTANDTLLEQYRHSIEAWESTTFHPKASLSKNHQRWVPEEIDHRLPYKRDVDRIVHSKANSRYADKTQVIYLVDNDHITHRSIHVQLVSSFARGIAEILRLNTNLVEAIALGHDVGHPPFGHEGEKYLSDLSLKHGEGYFAHPWQSCRLFTEIEPLNLGLAVYDGFLCHDGGMKNRFLEPQFGKTWDDYREDLRRKHEEPEGIFMPGTLEGCLVKICDTVSYVGRDIEDAISMGILSSDEIPNTILGKTNRDILTVVARDLITESYQKDYIAMSQEVFDALKTLRAFNFQKIYIHPRLKVESSKVKLSYRLLFEYLLEDFNKNGEKSHLWNDFLYNKSSKYLENSNGVRRVIDYIAGMTDRFFVKKLKALMIPSEIKL